MSSTPRITTGGRPTEASTYIVPAGRRPALGETLWDRHQFERRDLAKFVDRICGFDPGAS